MIDYGRIRSTVRPEEKVVDEFSVWVNTDVQEVQVSDDQGNHTEYEFHQVQYDKDEFIKVMDDKNAALEQQITDTQLALCDVYEMLG
ncbi:hypothetical protein IJ674_09280 [bacterium]|nr:hypothetical protein [bacterium]